MERNTEETSLLVDSETAASDSSSSITPVLVFSTFVAVCGSFCYGCSIGYSSPSESGIMEDLGLSLAQYSVFGSIMAIGGMVGAILSGKIADLVGRRRTMWLAEIFCTPGWLAIAFAKNSWWLDIGRLAIGFGVGLITYVVPVYVAEISPKNIRGRFASANQLMISFGFGLIYFIGNIISWRNLSLFAAIPCVIQLVGLFFIPESPRWLAKMDRQKEFDAALLRLRGKSADVSREASDIIDSIEIFRKTSEGRLLDLFQRRYAYAVTVGVGLMCLQQLGGNNGLGYYATSVFEKAGFSAFIGTTSAAVLQLPVGIVGLLLMDIFGRRTLLMISSAGSCLFLLLVGLSFSIKEFHYLTKITPSLVFIGIMGYGAAYGIGLSGIPWIIMSEIFPTNVKATAGSLVTLTNWFCSWIATYTFNFLMEWSSSGTFYIIGFFCGLTVLFAWMLVPETKGRTLEEIQASVTGIP